MNFPHAAKGISKIFTAEILQLISLVTGVVALLMGIVSAGTLQNAATAAAGVSGIIFIIFAAATGVLSIIYLIFMIIGTIQCAKDEASFKMIIYLTIVNVVIALVAAIFPGNYFLASLAATTSDVVSFVCSLLVILGVGSMAAQLGNEELMERCSRIFKIILAIGVMSLLARFFMLFWGSVFAQALVFALAVLSIFLGFFQYFLYISMLAKAKKMLNE